jgi:hypothetical protein
LGSSERPRVLVDPYETAGGSEPFQNFARVSPASEGAVDDGLAGLDPKEF